MDHFNPLEVSITILQHEPVAIASDCTAAIEEANNLP